MMGRRERGQGQFFYAFDLDKVVPPDHLVRQIDGVLDLDWVHKELAPYYSHTGRPSIDPMLMIRMLIVGYVFAIRSERRLCSEVQVNLAYRWFCQLGIEDRIPDHSVFSRARHERFRQSDALRRIFESVVAKCIAAGLVGGEGFSIDASLIRADVDKKKRTPGPHCRARAAHARRCIRHCRSSGAETAGPHRHPYRPGHSRGHWHAQIRLRCVGRHGEHREPHGIPLVAWPHSSFGGYTGCAWRSFQTRTAWNDRNQGQGDHGDIFLCALSPHFRRDHPPLPEERTSN